MDYCKQGSKYFRKMSIKLYNEKYEDEELNQYNKIGICIIKKYSQQKKTKFGIISKIWNIIKYYITESMGYIILGIFFGTFFEELFREAIVKKWIKNELILDNFSTVAIIILFFPFVLSIGISIYKYMKRKYNIRKMLIRLYDGEKDIYCRFINIETFLIKSFQNNDSMLKTNIGIIKAAINTDKESITIFTIFISFITLASKYVFFENQNLIMPFLIIIAYIIQVLVITYPRNHFILEVVKKIENDKNWDKD